LIASLASLLAADVAFSVIVFFAIVHAITPALRSKSIYLILRFPLGDFDMHHFKARLLALVLIIVSVVIIYINWHQLLQEHTYSMKMAAFGPLVGIGGIYLMFFPSKAGKPTPAKEKVMVLIVFAIGLVAGLINWYLMDPGFFSNP
jgi:hypothetical protein